MNSLSFRRTNTADCRRRARDRRGSISRSLAGSAAIRPFFATAGEFRPDEVQHPAVQFILCGISLLMLGTRWERATVCAGQAGGHRRTVGDHRDASRDGMPGSMKALFRMQTGYSELRGGRMSSLAAGGFLVWRACSLLLAGLAGGSRWRSIAAGMLACTVGMAGLVALYGYISPESNPPMAGDPTPNCQSRRPSLF